MRKKQYKWYFLFSVVVGGSELKFRRYITLDVKRLSENELELILKKIKEIECNDEMYSNLNVEYFKLLERVKIK